MDVNNHPIRRICRLILVLSVLLAAFCRCAGPARDQVKRPNIIIILGDDIGFSDLGCYGSEIHTPNLDALAEGGMRFKEFYNSAKCSPTRGSLLTGLYQGNEQAVNMATLFSQEGYVTIHTGKEHFDRWVPEHCYARNSFDHALYYRVTNEYHIPPDSTFYRPFCLDGRELSLEEIEVRKPPFFKTDVVTDYALKFMDQAHRQGKPFLLYLPYNVAHYPLQAKPPDIARYRGKYMAGWDVIRQQRYQRMKQLGIIGENHALSPPEGNINIFRKHPEGDDERRAKIPLYRPWEQLPEEEQDELDLEMSVFAAMVDCMDQNIGRIIGWLKENDLFENTIIMYFSDNGSCPYDSNRDFEHPPGPAGSYRTLCAAWANVGNTPFRHFKQFGHEGGSKTHFIVHWPRVISPGTVTGQTGHVVDIMPTLLDVTGIEYPDTVSGGKTIPLHGRSLYPVLKGGQREEPDYYISGYNERFRMFRMGDWKIVRANDRDWELYNMATDKTELVDLADSIPAKLTELSVMYDTILKEFQNY